MQAEHLPDLAGGGATAVDHLPPGEPDRLPPVEGGVEVALHVGVSGGGGVVEESAVELDDQPNCVLRVAIDELLPRVISALTGGDG